MAKCETSKRRKVEKRTMEEKDSVVRIKLMVAWCLLGLASWVQTNGIFQELPRIATKAPEGYDVFSYASLLVALSNVFPLCYLYVLNRVRVERCERLCIYLAVGCCGAAVCICLAFLYDHVTIFGDNHEVSLALFVLIFLAGGLDCTTSVVFFPVARRLSNDKRYITALMLGEAMTGLLTSVLSTLQSLNDYEILSIKTFFVILSFIVIFATMSFRYIETRMTLMKENRSNVPRWRKMDETRLFLGQAALAFVENGLHTTLLPHALASFPHSQTNISIATKIGTCTRFRIFFGHSF